MNLAGIDIANDTFEICLRRGDSVASRCFNNTNAGHRQAIRWLCYRNQPARICLEATGIYHLQLALALTEAEGIELMVLNPRASRRFADAQMRRAKTDKVDAAMLLSYLERMPFKPWRAPSTAVLELQSLAHRLSQLQKEIRREQCRLHACERAGAHTRFARQDIRAHLKQLTSRLERFEARAIDWLRQHPQLTDDLELIDSVPGFAERSAFKVLAEVRPLPADMTAPQWVAQAGLDPRPQESGSSVHSPRRISKLGNAKLRAALFFPAMVAIQRDANVKAFYEARLARGCKPRQAQVAVMRKLLHAIWGILQHRQPWQGHRFYRLTTT
ncbi:MAG: IS110 family transposase [Woeseiaceae bacterium]|jgi:transposase|nr:IS110 family transposase [Woeseiaceae bacterium]